MNLRVGTSGKSLPVAFVTTRKASEKRAGHDKCTDILDLFLQVNRFSKESEGEEKTPIFQNHFCIVTSD
ncbi:MAG: hypothetical protein AMJ73_06000 [candidate division Zixibacteria bacterium SM1_73]|nr:MAG: hypothetical protein AMJ73_06000 [candidate division Zixibacteria bacterium SM1_73]